MTIHFPKSSLLYFMAEKSARPHNHQYKPEEQTSEPDPPLNTLLEQARRDPAWRRILVEELIENHEQAFLKQVEAEATANKDTFYQRRNERELNEFRTLMADPLKKKTMQIIVALCRKPFTQEKEYRQKLQNTPRNQFLKRLYFRWKAYRAHRAFVKILYREFDKKYFHGEEREKNDDILKEFEERYFIQSADTYGGIYSSFTLTDYGYKLWNQYFEENL